MNIICNTCVGARIYEQINKRFENPFMWSLVRPNEFVFLINNYDNINFKNFKVKDNLVTIDNKVRVFFKHYKFGSYASPKKIKTDVFVKNLNGYVKQKYVDRMKRMRNQNPLFIIIVKDEVRKTDMFDEYAFTDVSMLKQIRTKHRTLVVTNQKLQSMNLPKNIQIVNIRTTRQPTSDIAKYLLNGKYIKYEH